MFFFYHLSLRRTRFAVNRSRLADGQSTVVTTGRHEQLERWTRPLLVIDVRLDSACNWTSNTFGHFERIAVRSNSPLGRPLSMSCPLKKHHFELGWQNELAASRSFVRRFRTGSDRERDRQQRSLSQLHFNHCTERLSVAQRGQPVLFDIRLALAFELEREFAHRFAQCRHSPLFAASNRHLCAAQPADGSHRGRQHIRDCGHLVGQKSAIGSKLSRAQFGDGRPDCRPAGHALGHRLRSATALGSRLGTVHFLDTGRRVQLHCIDSALARHRSGQVILLHSHHAHHVYVSLFEARSPVVSCVRCVTDTAFNRSICCFNTKRLLPLLIRFTRAFAGWPQKTRKNLKFNLNS